MRWSTNREGVECHHHFRQWSVLRTAGSFCLRGLRGKDEHTLLTRPWFPSRPEESKWLGILVLQHAEVGRVCVLSCVGGEPWSLP